MTEEMYWKSRTLVKRGKIKLDARTSNYLFFTIGCYDVMLTTKKGRDNNLKCHCTCEAGSIWSVGNDCSHISAAKLWISGFDLESLEGNGLLLKDCCSHAPKTPSKPKTRGDMK